MDKESAAGFLNPFDFVAPLRELCLRRLAIMLVFPIRVTSLKSVQSVFSDTAPSESSQDVSQGKGLSNHYRFVRFAVVREPRGEAIQTGGSWIASPLG